MDRHGCWPPVIIIVCVLLAFGRLVTAQFTWLDDHGTIVDNKYFGQSVDIGHFWAHSAADIYAPLTYTAWGVLAKMTWVQTPDETGSHVDARLFHGTNVLVHLIAALLVYALLLRIFRKPWAAMVGAMLFALHPLQVESVAWASGLKDVLAGMLSILALLLYVRFAESGRRAFFVAATVAFAAAILAKPAAVTTPLLATVIDWCFVGRPWRKIVGPLAIWLVMAVPIVIVNRTVQAASHAGLTPAWFRPLVAGDALAFYLYKLFVPVGLAIQYPLRPVEMIHSNPAYWGWLVPVAVAIAAVVARKRSLTAGGLIFVAALLPVLGLVPFDWQWYSAVADHYVYVAMLGPAVVVAAVLSKASRSVIGSCLALVLGLGALSFRQCGFWIENDRLAEHALEMNPRSFVAYTILGANHIVSDPDRAIAEFKAVLAIEPRSEKVAAILNAMLEAQRHGGAAKEPSR